MKEMTFTKCQNDDFVFFLGRIIQTAYFELSMNNERQVILGILISYDY